MNKFIVGIKKKELCFIIFFVYFDAWFLCLYMLYCNSKNLIYSHRVSAILLWIWSVKREWGENPLRWYCRCMCRSFYTRWWKPVIGKLRRQSIKMQSISFIWYESEDLLWCYPVSVLLGIGVMFLFALDHICIIWILVRALLLCGQIVI